RPALRDDASVGDLHGAVRAVQLHLGAILDDGERLAELVEMREGADDVMEELDAAPRHMLGGHEQTFLLRPARLQNVHQRSRARRSLATPAGRCKWFRGALQGQIPIEVAKD